jgi:hypothetical protein
VDALQFSRAFHRAQIAPDRLRRNAQSAGDIDDIDASVSGKQLGDRLVASYGLRVLDGHRILSLVRLGGGRLQQFQ